MTAQSVGLIDFSELNRRPETTWDRKLATSREARDLHNRRMAIWKDACRQAWDAGFALIARSEVAVVFRKKDVFYPKGGQRCVT